MGKMLKALEKAKELRNNGYAIAMPTGNARIHVAEADRAHGSGAAKFETKIEVVCAVIFMVGLMSLSVSFKVVSELQKARKMDAVLLKNMSGQKEDIRHLEELISETALAKMTRLEQMVEELSDLEIHYNLLKISVEDLKLSDRLLLEKYIGLNERMRKIEDGK